MKIRLWCENEKTGEQTLYELTLDQITGAELRRIATTPSIPAENWHGTSIKLGVKNSAFTLEILDDAKTVASIDEIKTIGFET